jgi:hypothetical protein
MDRENRQGGWKKRMKVRRQGGSKKDKGEEARRIKKGRREKWSAV